MTKEASKKIDANTKPKKDMASEKLEQEQSTESPSIKPSFSRIRKFLTTKKGKWVAIVGGVLFVLSLLLLVPALRDPTFGQIVTKQVRVVVIDDRSNAAVSGATVTVGGKSAETDADGVAAFDGVPSTGQTVSVEKLYYDSKKISYRVPFFSGSEKQKIKIHATGTPLTYMVTDSVTSKPIIGATVSYGEANATTDSNGKAVVVLPYDDKDQKVTFTKEGYNSSQRTENTSMPQQQPAAFFATLTPAGKVMYLSKASGQIDVIQSNLDGSGATTIYEGTGAESDYSTVMLASRDWRYGALLVSVGESQKLYLIDGQKQEKVLIDDGKISFDLKGWSGHKFVYTINREDREYWQDKRQALKVYDAGSQSLQQVDDTTGFSSTYGTYAVEQYSNVYILDGEIVSVKTWTLGNRYNYYAGYSGSSKDATITSINPDDLSKKVVGRIEQDKSTSVESKLYEPQAVYLRIMKNYETKTAKFYEYEDGALKELSDYSNDRYIKNYPTYLISPSGQKSFWYDQRNGKNTLFIGDKEGKNEKEVASLSEYKPYGWFGDNDRYVLVTKDDSELYVAAPDMLGDKDYKPLEISTIHKPQSRYLGYGYGYGGQ